MLETNLHIFSMNRDNGHSLKEIAAYIKAELEGDPEHRIHGLATLAAAENTQLAFLANKNYQKHLADTGAGCVLLSPSMSALFSGNKLVMNDPYLGFARLTALFKHPAAETIGYDGGNIHPTAVVHDNASIAEDVLIGPQVVVEQGVSIGNGTIIGAGCFIGKNSAIGKDTQLHANVTINPGVCIGSNVIVHSGAVIGADGFGFARDGEHWQKIYQLGGVEVGDHVEIGACSTIDRGALGNTVLEEGVKIDNQVQIAHNVRIGAHTAIAGCAGIAGSAIIGKHCTIAGGVGIVGHVTIADHVHITGMTMVSKSIDEAGSYSSGVPMLPTKKWRKNAVRFSQLDDLIRKLKNLITE